MEYENKHEFASKGVAGSGLGLGIAGTTTTAQPTYNPVFNCGGCCNR